MLVCLLFVFASNTGIVIGIVIVFVVAMVIVIAVVIVNC